MIKGPFTPEQKNSKTPANLLYSLGFCWFFAPLGMDGYTLLEVILERESGRKY